MDQRSRSDGDGHGNLVNWIITPEPLNGFKPKLTQIDITLGTRTDYVFKVRGQGHEQTNTCHEGDKPFNLQRRASLVFITLSCLFQSTFEMVLTIEILIAVTHSTTRGTQLQTKRVE